jgi:ribosomal protein L35AE/L33A
MKAEVKQDTYNGNYKLTKGQVVTYRKSKWTKDRIEVLVKVKNDTWSEFDQNII